MNPMQMRPALLVLGWGNRSRGDDALGPLCVDMLRQRMPHEWRQQVEWLEDHQLQIEHALDLLGRQGVLLIDASREGCAPYQVTRPTPQRDHSFSTHALTPAALAQVCVDQFGVTPAITLLAIRGQSFELGDGLSVQAESHLLSAVSWAQEWCRTGVGAALARES